MLTDAMKQNILRLGGTIPDNLAQDSITALTRDIVWPEGEFTRSLTRFRNLIDDENSYNEYELEDRMPWLRSLCFLKQDDQGKFWDGWESDFSGTDPSTHVPFAADEAYFYFIRSNSKNPDDPIVSTVDHEEVNEEPYDRNGFTVSMLLATIEADV